MSAGRDGDIGVMRKRTEFGRYCYLLRARHDEPQYILAECLGCSAAYLSAVEHGKRAIPAKWRDKIVAKYKLSHDDVRELDTAIALSGATVRIDLDNSSEIKRRAALCFEEAYPRLSEDTAQRIIDIISEDKLVID